MGAGIPCEITEIQPPTESYEFIRQNYLFLFFQHIKKLVVIPVVENSLFGADLL